MRRLLLLIMLIATFAGGLCLGRRTRSLDPGDALRAARQRVETGWQNAAAAGREALAHRDGGGDAE
ncbi:MAG: hypothetical protein ACLFVW_09345 [Phycisphaerae bacterium]